MRISVLSSPASVRGNLDFRTLQAHYSPIRTSPWLVGGSVSPVHQRCVNSRNVEREGGFYGCFVAKSCSIFLLSLSVMNRRGHPAYSGHGLTGQESVGKNEGQFQKGWSFIHIQNNNKKICSSSTLRFKNVSHTYDTAVCAPMWFTGEMDSSTQSGII